MIYVLPFLIGFLVAFIGLLAPAMLNMTTARTSIEKGKKAGFQFAAGAASVVFIQGYIAVTFAKYLVENPEIIKKLNIAAVFVLFGLSIFFFIQARRKFEVTGKSKKGNNYLSGLLMSSLNMLAIPFYLAMATLAESEGWMTNEKPYSIIFVVGAVLGSFFLFSVYAVFAKSIALKAAFISRNINYILSVLFIGLAMFTLIKLLM